MLKDDFKPTILMDWKAGKDCGKNGAARCRQLVSSTNMEVMEIDRG